MTIVRAVVILGAGCFLTLGLHGAWARADWRAAAIAVLASALNALIFWR